MDFIEVKDFLEEKGIPELNHELVLDHIKNPNYINVLKRHKAH